MYTFFSPILMYVLRYLLTSEMIHNKLRELAKGTATDIDDALAEKAIEIFKELAKKTG
jgi:hypothetical protein